MSSAIQKKKQKTHSSTLQNFLKKKGLELSTDVNKTKVTSIQNDYIIFLGIRIDAHKLSYKRNKTETQNHIKEILDEKNHELYGRYKKPEDKVKAMNYKIQGLGNYLRFYHTEEAFDEINKWVAIKRKMKSFNDLEQLDKKKITPIIKRKDWEQLFK